MPIKPSSPSDMSNALVNIDEGARMQENAFFDDMMSIAQLMNQRSELTSKIGSSTSVGSDKLAKRIDLLPYVATEGKDKSQLTEEVRLLLTEPDDDRALSGINFGSKKSTKQIVVSKEIAQALKKAGYDYPEGTIVNQADYNNLINAAKLGNSTEREKRLSLTVPKDLLLKEINLELKKLNLKDKKMEAAVNDLIEKKLKEMTTSEGARE